MKIKEMSEAIEKQRIARLILEALTDWFEIPEAREDYIYMKVQTIHSMQHTMRTNRLGSST